MDWEQAFAVGIPNIFEPKNIYVPNIVPIEILNISDTTNTKKSETKDNLQNFFDFCVRQIELSIREIGYGDATINKKMKEYVNLLFSIIDKIDNWETKDNMQKREIISIYIEDMTNFNDFINYFEKYRKYLINNTFNNLTKDIISD